MPEVAKFLFTSLKTRHFVNLLPLSSSNSPAISAIRVSWRGGSVASARLSKISIHLVGALACSSSSSKRSCAAKGGVSQCLEWKGSNFSNPLAGLVFGNFMDLGGRVGRFSKKHTNTLWPSSMWPAVSKRLNCWPPKNRLRCQALFRKFTNAGLWNGHSFCKWILDGNLWVLSPRRSKNTHQTFEVGGWLFTEIRLSSKD